MVETENADKTQLQAALAGLRADVPVNLQVSTSRFQAFVQTLNAKIAVADIVAPVALDIANTTAFQAKIAQFTQTETKIIKIQTVGGGGGSGGGGLGGLDLSLGKVTQNGAKLGAVSAMVGAIGGAKRIDTANERVSDSEQSLIEANQALQEAMSSSGSAADKAAEALAKLLPNAQAFAVAMSGLKPQFDELMNVLQDNMFAGLDSVFTDLVQTSMSMLKEGMGGVATSINGAANEFASFWSSAEAQEGLGDIFAGTPVH